MSSEASWETGDSLNAMCFKIWIVEPFFVVVCFVNFSTICGKNCWVLPDAFNNQKPWSILCFRLQLYLEKALIRFGSRMHRWWEIPAPGWWQYTRSWHTSDFEICVRCGVLWCLLLESQWKICWQKNEELIVDGWVDWGMIQWFSKIVWWMSK